MKINLLEKAFVSFDDILVSSDTKFFQFKVKMFDSANRHRIISASTTNIASAIRRNSHVSETIDERHGAFSPDFVAVFEAQRAIHQVACAVK